MTGVQLQLGGFLLLCRCGSPDLVCVEPGDDAVFGPVAERAPVGWCAACAPWLQRVEGAA